MPLCVCSKPSLIKLASHKALKQGRTINKQSDLLWLALLLCTTSFTSTLLSNHMVDVLHVECPASAGTEPLSVCVQTVQLGAQPSKGLDVLDEHG